MVFADIATGETGVADIMFLIAVIAAVVAIMCQMVRVAESAVLGNIAMAVAVGAIAMGLLLQ